MSKRVIVPIVLLLVGACVIAALAGVLVYLLRVPAVEARPVVFINSPTYGQQAEVGETLSVQALARDETKVTRVELWVDGALLTSQESNLPGGVSHLPLFANWQPVSAGTHTLIVRAFNAQNGRAYGSVNVEAIEGADLDGDGVADVFDACADELGSPLAAGCPDADGDTVADADDSCPDEAGLIEYDGCAMTDDRDLDGIADDQDECPDQAGSLATEGCPDADRDTIPDHADACPEQPGALGAPSAEGCPAPTANDRDGDGTLDSEDECADEAGSPLAEGCPDGDGDMVRDGDDDCPAEPGPLGADGCPLPGGGEDSDGDGILDVDDGCPEEWGLPEYAGCPDTDRDGVPDPDDLRPEDASPPETGGTDSDGDGVPDDDDRCVSEEGLAEHDGCPPPGPEGGAQEPAGSGLVTMLLGGLEVLPEPVAKADVDVEVEVLWFETDDPYNSVYCYVSLAGGPEERYSLSRMGEFRWDRLFEGQNAVTIAADDAELLEMRMDCGGYSADYEATFDLGSILVGHGVEDWDGTVFEARSTGGTSGRSFNVKYRLCLNSCEVAGLPAPRLSAVDLGVGQHQLAWEWGGDPGEMVGFKLYINGAFNGNSFNRDARSWVLPESMEPTCTETVELQLTAFSGNTFTPDQESPRSETVVLEGPPCPRTVRVTFDHLDTYDLRDESRMDGDQGPIFGFFGANGEGFDFDGSDYPNGYTLSPWSSYNIQDIFDTIFPWQLGCWDWHGCPYYAPDANSVTVELGPDDDLTINGYIYDQDESGGYYEGVFDGHQSIPFDDIVPGPLEISDGQVQLTVQIDVLVGPGVGPLPDLTISDVTSSEGGQLRIYVFNNAADLVNQDLTVQIERLSTAEVLATPTWPNMTIPSGGEVRLEPPDLLLEPHDLRVAVDPGPEDTIEEMNERNNVYETPVVMRVEFTELLAFPCESFLDLETEHWFYLSVAHGPSPDEAVSVGGRRRYPASGTVDLDTYEDAVGDDPDYWAHWYPSEDEPDRFVVQFEMPVDDTVYMEASGYEDDPAQDDRLGYISAEYGPDVNYGDSDDTYSDHSPDQGCNEVAPPAWDYFGFYAWWRITRVH
jgi:hypothetical protein